MLKLSKAEKQFLRRRECGWCGMRLYPLVCGSFGNILECKQANLEGRAQCCLKTNRRVVAKTA